MLNWTIGIGSLILYTIGMGLLIYTKLKKKKQTFNDLELRFHKEANVFGEHGTINVTHVKHGLVETTVRFVIVGMTTPPQLTKDVFNLIWEEAKNQGYIPHHFVTYGRENEVVNAFPAIHPKEEVQAPAASFKEIKLMPPAPAPTVAPAKHGAMSVVWAQDEPKEKRH